MRLQIGRRADLALKVLRLLATERHGWTSRQLAIAAWTTPEFVDEALRSFEQRRWIEPDANGWRYAESSDHPSLLDVIESVEGPLRLDACVLREGKLCGWAAGEPTCSFHEAWQQLYASLSEQLTAIDAVPLPGERSVAPIPSGA